MENHLTNSFLNNVSILIDEKLPLVSNLANLTVLFKMQFKNTSWSGFYLVDTKKNQLFLGPFQGDLACTIIGYNKGVCGTCYASKESQLVENVHSIANHIACSSSTNSEIVVPILKENEVVGVIDLDSDRLSNYTKEDMFLLEKAAKIISTLF